MAKTYTKYAVQTTFTFTIPRKKVTHASHDGISTVCGFDVGVDWMVITTHFNSAITCPACLNSLDSNPLIEDQENFTGIDRSAGSRSLDVLAAEVKAIADD